MPTDMLPFGFQDLDLFPDLGKTFARSEGGLVITSNRTDPFWKGRMSTGRLSVVGPTMQHPQFLAWLSWVVDLNMRVDFVHPRQRLPRAYTDANWPMVGNAELQQVPDLRTLVVSGMVLGMTLLRGDRLAVVHNDVIVHRWIEKDTVVSSVGLQALPITPRLPIGVVTAGDPVVFKDPKLRFMVVPGSWDTAEAYQPSPVSFDVMEALR